MAQEQTVDFTMPARLRKLAAEAGTEPANIIRGAIDSTDTLEDAAAKLGVSVTTFRTWRRMTGVWVTR